MNQKLKSPGISGAFNDFFGRDDTSGFSGFLETRGGLNFFSVRYGFQGSGPIGFSWDWMAFRFYRIRFFWYWIADTNIETNER